jgi:hypothetical protein
MSVSDPALLLELARGRWPADASTERVDALYDLAATHGLVGFVQQTLEKQHVVLPRWKDFTDQTELAAKVQLKAAAEVASAFLSNGIDAVFVKGVALAASVYARPVRPFNDLDVLIKPEQLRAAHRTLVTLGYAPNNALGNPTELDYVRESLPGFRICIDLHWDFTAEDGMQAGVRMPLGEILARKKVVQGIPTPSPEDALLFAAANFSRKCAEPLILLFDLAQMIQHPVEWEQVVTRAGQWGLKTPLWVGLSLARRMLSAEVPARVLEQLSPSPKKSQRLVNMLGDEQLWYLHKSAAVRYRIFFKLRCIDSWSGLFKVASGLPSGVLRKLGLTENLAAKMLREEAATSPHRA